MLGIVEQGFQWSSPQTINPVVLETEESKTEGGAFNRVRRFHLQLKTGTVIWAGEIRGESRLNFPISKSSKPIPERGLYSGISIIRFAKRQTVGIELYWRLPVQSQPDKSILALNKLMEITRT
jgi:hypothetical protein